MRINRNRGAKTFPRRRRICGGEGFFAGISGAHPAGTASSRLSPKRLICALLAALLLLSPAVLTSCGGDGGKDGLTVVCTNFPCYDFARRLCLGTDAEIVMLLPPGGESHSYDPTPKDIASIARADVFVYVGGESDEWANGVIASADNEDLRIFRLMDAVNLREEEIPEGADEDHDHGEEDGASDHGDGADLADGHAHGGEYDEHVWTSPVNVISICAALRGVLAESAPEFADTFAANESEYRAELEKLDASFREVVGSGARRTVVFGDRFPLLYFAKEYGLDYYAAFPGCSSAVEASPAAVAFLIGKVKEENIPAVFHIELSKTEICEAIAEETGAKVLQFNACHNLTAEQFAAGATYISLMTENLSALATALG